MTFEAIVDEIATHLDLPSQAVSQRLWMEALEGSWYVRQQVKTYGVTSHDEHMERLYKEGDGFIFETLAFWSWLQLGSCFATWRWRNAVP